jgi:alpha-galactosidase
VDLNLCFCFPFVFVCRYRTQFSVYAVAASPLIVATDVRNMTEIMSHILLNAEALEVNQQSTPPGDVIGEIGPEGSVQIWSRLIRTQQGAMPTVALAVAAVNFGDSIATVDLPFEMLGQGWGANTSLAVRDIWARDDACSTGKNALCKGSISLTIQAHDTKLLRFSSPGHA